MYKFDTIEKFKFASCSEIYLAKTYGEVGIKLSLRYNYIIDGFLSTGYSRTRVYFSHYRNRFRTDSETISLIAYTMFDA